MASEVAFCNPDAGAESTPRGPGGNYGPRNLGFSLRSGREYRTGNRCMDLRDGNGIKGYGSRTSISRNSAAPVAEHAYLADAVVNNDRIYLRGIAFEALVAMLVTVRAVSVRASEIRAGELLERGRRDENIASPKQHRLSADCRRAPQVLATSPDGCT